MQDFFLIGRFLSVYSVEVEALSVYTVRHPARGEHAMPWRALAAAQRSGYNDNTSRAGRRPALDELADD